jgi:adenine-specific DNA-methyltransferase
VLRECHRVLKPTGSIFWQTGMFTHQGTVVPLDVKCFPMLEKLGMQPRNRIVWIRHAKAKFSGRHETIIWFSKSDDYRFDLDAVRVPQKWPGKRAHRGPWAQQGRADLPSRRQEPGRRLGLPERQAQP